MDMQLQEILLIFNTACYNKSVFTTHPNPAQIENKSSCFLTQSNTVVFRIIK